LPGRGSISGKPYGLNYEMIIILHYILYLYCIHDQLSPYNVACDL
jgi:hypothetical protein